MQSVARKNVNQNSAGGDLQIKIAAEQLTHFVIEIGVEKNSGATGSVEIYVRRLGAATFNRMTDAFGTPVSVNLSAITEPENYVGKGAISEVKFVPVGVSGEFNIFVIGY